MNIEIYETYKTGLTHAFGDMWECRNKEGWLLGVGDTVNEAEKDVETFNIQTKTSSNMKRYGLS